MDHKPNDQLRAEIKAAKQQIKLGSTYAHYKDDTKHYKVLNFVVLEEGDVVSVLYEQQYDDRLQFVRPVEVWLQVVEWDGKKLQRFKLVE